MVTMGIAISAPPDEISTYQVLQKCSFQALAPSLHLSPV